jgi:ribonuclease HI
MSKRKKHVDDESFCRIYFDGATRPTNPGQASCGAVIDIPNGESITVSKALGWQTNNFAEYSGLVIGCQKALELGYKGASIKGDSRLVVNQITGYYPVKSDNLLPLYEQALSLLCQFDFYVIKWIPRHENERADAAAGSVLPQLQHQALALLDNLPMDLPTVAPRNGLENQIQKLLSIGEDAQFYNYLSLKSGRDEFSSKRMPALLKLVPEEVKDAISSQLKEGEDEEFLGICYRWYLRGLPAQFALRKARVELEIRSSFNNPPVSPVPPRRHQLKTVPCAYLDCGREWSEPFTSERSFSTDPITCPECGITHVLAYWSETKTEG